MSEKPVKQFRASNLRDDIYEIVKEMIISREIQPGEKINEEVLADRLGISRTPIRETLCRLETEGIVKIIPRRGTFVGTLSKEKVEWILEVREVLEGLVARLASANMDKRTLRKLRVGLERLKGDPGKEDKLVAYSKADTEFHSVLLEKAGNLVLKSMMEVLSG